jgi:hypothetical protein
MKMMTIVISLATDSDWDVKDRSYDILSRVDNTTDINMQYRLKHDTRNEAIHAITTKTTVTRGLNSRWKDHKK